MTPEDAGWVMFGISLRDSDFAHIKTPEEMTEKVTAAVTAGIRQSVLAEREACAKLAYNYGCVDARDAIMRRTKSEE